MKEVIREVVSHPYEFSLLASCGFDALRALRESLQSRL